MNDSAKHPFELVLQLCAQAAPEPWYPSIYVKETGTDREKLDPYLDQLRMGGLIRLTDWVQGCGQGYALTQAGQQVVQNPRLMSRLLAGKFSVRNGEASSGGQPAERRKAPTTWEKGEAVRQGLNPVPPVISYALMLANILVFLAGCYLGAREQIDPKDFVAGNPDVVQETGGVTAIDLLRGQWWRLITCLFVHFGLIHLGLNMYALFALGQMAERIWGRLRFLIIYFVAGFGGSCVAMALRPGEVEKGVIVQALLAGASGAICGIFAAEAGWAYLNRQHLSIQSFMAWQRNFLINLIILIYVSFSISSVSWEGHLGGALAGLAVAFLLNRFQFERGLPRWTAMAGLLLAPVVCLGFLLRAMNSSHKWQPFVQYVQQRQARSSANERPR